jgi:hypothetical protein
MAFKDWFAVRANLETRALPGSVRVKIRIGQTWVAILSEIAFFGWLLWTTAYKWEESLWARLIAGWGLLIAGVALFYFLTSSEVIEFDRDNLTIRRNLLGWQRISRYPVEECSELTWRNQQESGEAALECKVGWRTIKFARYATEDEARNILTLLQKELPEVAKKMTGAAEGHYTQLGLNKEN